MNPDQLQPTLDLNLGAPIDTSNINALVTPTGNQNGTGSWIDGINTVTKNLLNLFDNGAAVYNEVNSITGGANTRNAAAQQSPVAPTVAAPSTLGIPNSTLLWVAGGLTLLLIVSISRRG